MADTFFQMSLLNLFQKTLDNCLYRADRVDVNVNLDLINSDWQDYFNLNVFSRGYYNKGHI